MTELEYLPSMSDRGYDSWLARRHFVNIAAAAVLAFYLQCLAIVMSSSQTPSAVSQQWTDQEIEAILQYFITHNSEIGDAGNFKKKTYSAAAATIPGQTRTSAQVQTKWQGVSLYHYHFSKAISLISYIFSSNRHIGPSRLIKTHRGFTGIVRKMRRTLGLVRK